MLGPDPLRRDEPFVGVRRRHADVGDRDVGPGAGHLAQQRVPVLGLADDLHPPPPPRPETPPPSAPTRSVSRCGSAWIGPIVTATSPSACSTVTARWPS